MGRRRHDEASLRAQALRVKIVFYVFFAFALFIVVLLAAPQGLFGTSAARRV